MAGRWAGERRSCVSSATASTPSSSAFRSAGCGSCSTVAGAAGTTSSAGPAWSKPDLGAPPMTDTPGIPPSNPDRDGDLTATISLVLEAPPAVAPVQPEQAETALGMEPAASAAIDAMVDTFLDDVTALDVHGPDFGRRVEDVRTLANEDIPASAQVSNTLLAKPLAAMNDSGIGQASGVSRSLL